MGRLCAARWRRGLRQYSNNAYGSLLSAQRLVTSAFRSPPEAHVVRTHMQQLAHHNVPPLFGLGRISADRSNQL